MEDLRLLLLPEQDATEFFREGALSELLLGCWVV